MLVSVIIPACNAQSTLVRALESLRAQTWQEWEAIIVADDLFDYSTFLSSRELKDKRIHFASTGSVRTGCHNARNAGLAENRSELIAMLDADDEFLPPRLATLAPLAKQHGAAADNVSITLDSSNAELYRVMGMIEKPVAIDLAQFFTMTAPLFPVLRLDYAQPREPGIEFAEDVVANMQLIDRLGALTIIPEPLYQYRVIDGSLAHSDQSAEFFETAYTDYIARCESGDGFGFSLASRKIAANGLAAKRALNREFAKAKTANPPLNFQTFVAARRKAA